VLLACSLLTDEKVESFEWAFACLAEVAGAPALLLTDQDHAMARAVKNVLPTTVHKLCTWHMSHNFLKNLSGRGTTIKEAIKLFNHLVYEDDLTEEAFDEQWRVLAAMFPPGKKRYLNTLYENRFKWSRSLCPATFDAGMTTSQRSESFHALIKQHLHKRTTLPQLLAVLLDQVAGREDQRATETSLKARERTRLQQGDSILVARLAGSLTNYAFNLAVTAYKDSLHFVYDHASNTVKRLVQQGGQEAWTIRADGGCSCKHATFLGLPCPHIFTHARVLQVQELPPTIVLPRWMEDAPVRVLQPVPSDLLATWDAGTGMPAEEEDEEAVFLREFHARKHSLKAMGKMGELLGLMQRMSMEPLEEDAVSESLTDVAQDVAQDVVPSAAPTPLPPATLPLVITQDTELPAGVRICDPAPHDIKRKGRKARSELLRAAKRLKSSLETRGYAKSAKPVPLPPLPRSAEP
jgi:hypothetical protein